MAYEALSAVWSTLGAPANVTGDPLTAGMTAQQKLSAINGWRVPTGVVPRAIVPPSDIINAIVPADMLALTQLQILQLSMLLSGSSVDASPGTSIRAALASIFVNKVTTLGNLSVLASQFTDPGRPWTDANGLPNPLGTADLTIAGLT